MIKQCHLCKAYGHYSPDCPKYGPRPSTVAQVCERAVERQKAEESRKHIKEMRSRDQRFHAEGMRRSIDTLLSSVFEGELEARLKLQETDKRLC